MGTQHARPRDATESVAVRCRLFARYAEVAGASDVTLTLPVGATVTDAVMALRSRLANGEHLPERPLVAVNHVHALGTDILTDGDELALLPPLAGG